MLVGRKLTDVSGDGAGARNDSQPDLEAWLRCARRFGGPCGILCVLKISYAVATCSAASGTKPEME